MGNRSPFERTNVRSEPPAVMRPSRAFSAPRRQSSRLGSDRWAQHMCAIAVRHAALCCRTWHRGGGASRPPCGAAFAGAVLLALFAWIATSMIWYKTVFASNNSDLVLSADPRAFVARLGRKAPATQGRTRSYCGFIQRRLLAPFGEITRPSRESVTRHARRKQRDGKSISIVGSAGKRHYTTPMRTPFKVDDMRRALRAVKDEGLSVDRVEVDPTGKFCYRVRDNSAAGSGRPTRQMDSDTCDCALKA
jgi:hypothetical protein